jgi:hypothetical protein
MTPPSHRTSRSDIDVDMGAEWRSLRVIADPSKQATPRSMMSGLEIGYPHHVKIDGTAGQMKASWIAADLLVPARITITPSDTDVPAQSFAKLF